MDSNGDSTFSVDVDMPDAADLDIDLEYIMESQGHSLLLSILYPRVHNFLDNLGNEQTSLGPFEQ